MKLKSRTWLASRQQSRATGYCLPCNKTFKKQ
ncbi:Uncharacterised protein [Mycobacteroides abscessus subsp. abscessus]|nr:Uncharacterised protein [Mycobacteroides abscessus subsp. abscessus]